MTTHKPLKKKLKQIVDNTTENGRTYAVDGKIYPSITTVLAQNDVEWLTEWRERVGTRMAQEISDRATIQGNTVHDMAERYLNNEPLESLVINREEQHRFMFHQLRWKLRHIDNVVLQEVGLYSHKLKVAGRVDCIGEYRKMPAIIDFKTSTNVKDITKIGNYFKQGAAYSVMWRELTGITIDKVVILMAVKNRLTPSVFIESVDDWIEPLQQDIDAFYKSDHGLEIAL